MPSTPFADCPTSLDVLVVPGGLDGSLKMMDDQDVLDFLADRGRTTRYVTSDCTGPLAVDERSTCARSPANSAAREKAARIGAKFRS